MNYRPLWFSLLYIGWVALPVYVNGQTKNEALPIASEVRHINEKINLLDDSLSYWYPWLGVPHNTVQGLPAGTLTGDGFHGTPLGVNDPTSVFKIITVDGERVLRVSGQIYGGLTTKAVYQNYHLRLEYKWGQKQWPPRHLKTRGGGILFHLTGTNEEAYWSAFLMGLEFQIAEGTTDDMLFMANKDSTQIPAVVSRVGRQKTWSADAPFAPVGGHQWRP